MPAPKPKKKVPPRRQAPLKRRVQFHFTAHTEGAHYLPPETTLNSKSVVLLEDASGISYPLVQDFFDFNRIRGTPLSKFQRSGLEFIREAFATAKVVTGGEHPISPENRLQLNQLVKLDNSAVLLYHKIFENPNIETLRAWIILEGRFSAFRHRMILRSIRHYHQNPSDSILARYGTAHSILSHQSRKKGIPSTRTISPQLFNHYNIITRKLALGKKPGSIPDADFIRAFLSISTMNPVCGIIVQNSVGGVTDKVVIRASTISRALIDQLDEGQLLEVFKKCQHIIKKNSKNKVAAEISKVLFTLRGLPPNPSADQLWNFARKHSTFAKWQASRAKIKRRKK